MQNSPLVLGAMMFGTRIDDDTSFALLDRFVEAGGEWIDTADCYAFWASDTGFGGDSERLLGRWFAARPGVRERVKLATKLGAEPTVKDGWPAHREGLSATAVRDAFAGSLDRLGLDRSTCCGCTWRTAPSPSRRPWMRWPAWSPPVRSAVWGLPITRPGAWNAPGTTPRPPAPSRSTRSSTTPPICARALERLPPGVVHRFGVLSDEQHDLAVDDGLDIWAYTPLLLRRVRQPGQADPRGLRPPW